MWLDSCFPCNLLHLFHGVYEIIKQRVAINLANKVSEISTDEGRFSGDKTVSYNLINVDLKAFIST